jgi:hypothetical protein
LRRCPDGLIKSTRVIDRQIEQCISAGNRQELADILDDQVVIKRIETARYSETISQKALGVLYNSINSERISTLMLIRIVATLFKLSSRFFTELNPRQRGLRPVAKKKPG